MKDVGRDFGFAGFARGIDQLLVNSFEPGCAFTNFGLEQFICRLEFSLFGMKMPEQQCVDSEQSANRRDGAADFEPCSFVEMRRKLELKTVAFRVPDPIAVAGLDVKSI